MPQGASCGADQPPTFSMTVSASEFVTPPLRSQAELSPPPSLSLLSSRCVGGRRAILSLSGSLLGSALSPATRRPPRILRCVRALLAHKLFHRSTVLEELH
eukprot:6481175-Amphidinium_carterae.2